MKIIDITTSFLLVLSFACVASCANDTLEEECWTSDIVNSEVHTQSMQISFGKPVFDNSVNTRSGVSEEWKDGDVLYLRFQTDESYIQGKAVYNINTNNWTVTYTGDLPIEKECPLQVWYFDGETYEESDYVNLSAETSPYCDNDGFYLYNNDKELTCVACLKPASGRVRFVGNSGTKITIEGLCTFAYNTKDGILSYRPTTSIGLTVLPTGSTPYIYVTQNDSEEELCISDSQNDFCMTMDETFLKNNGSSGYINIPSSSKHDGWDMFEHHDYIDLGLPSGTLWATCNVGATNPEDFGNYYAWGEIETKNSYEYINYKWGVNVRDKYTKYVCNGEFGWNYFTDNKSKLEPEDDVAHVLWHRGWHMPDAEQFQELIDNCKWNYTTINNIYVHVGTSKLNGNEIIFPAASLFGNYQYVLPGEIAYSGYYWTCDLGGSSSENNGRSCDFFVADAGSRSSVAIRNRHLGLTVRPVKLSVNK